MILSNTLKLKFLKDTGLPIQVVQEPYFSYSLKIIDKDFNSLSQFKLFKETLERMGEDAFLKEYSKISKAAIEYIQSKDGYKKLQDTTIQRHDITLNTETLYQEKNNFEHFVSIDLVKANFNALKYFDKSILPDNYLEFISMFSDEKYFQTSKNLRQIIFGAILPRKLQQIQRNIILELSKELDVFERSSSSSDELVIKTSDIHQIKLLVEDKFNFLRIERFVLNNIIEDYYVREYDDKVEFKKCPSLKFLQIYKFYNNKEIIEADRKFYYERELATFEKSILEKEDPR